MQDREAMVKRRNEMNAINETLLAQFDEKVKSILTKEQLDKQTKIQEAIDTFVKTSSEAMADVHQAIMPAAFRPAMKPETMPAAPPAPAPVAPPPAAPDAK
jgi:hypothetical protein